MPGFLFAVVALLLMLATALPLTHWRQWWVRGCDFPRLQIACALALLIVIQILWMASGAEAPSPLWLLFLTVCLGYQIYWIGRYSELHALEVLQATARESLQGQHLKVLTSNVLMSNRDSSRLVAHVQREQPDVLVTLETDQWWQDQLDGLEAYPHRIACPLDNRYGMHVYSRLPLHQSRVEYLVEEDIPSMSAYLELADGQRVRFHALHPTPPAPGENPRSSERDVELLMVAKQLEHNSDVTLVTGDLNDVAWSSTTQLFRDRSRLLDPRVGRGMFNTFHADYWFLRWPLDHVFVSPHWRLVDMRRLGGIGSDHFPVLFELVVSENLTLETHPEADDVDEELEADTLEEEAASGAERPSMSNRAA